MPAIYVYSERADIASELVALARTGADEVFAFASGDEEATALSECGADGLLRIEGESQLIECYAASLASFLAERGAKAFLVGATPRGRDLAARVAGYADCPMGSDVSAAEFTDAGVRFTRTLYGGSVERDESFEGFGVLTIPAGGADMASGPCPAKALRLGCDMRTSLLDTMVEERDAVDLADAKAIVSVGMGVGAEDDMAMIGKLADLLGAEIGCTRGIAENRGWLPVERYIGISGLTAAPKFALTVGTSGQVQHLFGLRGAGVLAGIDKNEGAPLFSSVDYGVVGDLYEIVPLLVKALEG